MKLILNTAAALALTATSALAMSVEGPAQDLSTVAPTTGAQVMILVPEFNDSTRSGVEAVNGKVTVTLFEGASQANTAPNGAHFR